MRGLLLVAAGGAIGASARYLLAKGLAAWDWNHVPWYTTVDDDITAPASSCDVDRYDDICDSGETLRWTLGVLEPGESRVLQVPVKVNSDAPTGRLF